MLWSYRDGFASYPRWSPDGSKIAFAGQTSNTDRVQLWIMDADGGNPRRLTTTGVLDFFSWHPDGGAIAYTRYDRYDPSLVNGTIWIVDIASGTTRQLTVNTPEG
jgi:Tol biopolymer transport system component